MKGNKKRALRRSLFFFFLFPISPAPKSKCCNNNNSKGSASKLQRCLNKLLTAAWASFRYPSSLSHLAHLSHFFFLCVDPEIIGVLRRETTMLVKDSLPLSTRKLLSPFLRISVIYLFLTNCGGSFFFFLARVLFRYRIERE